MFPYRTTNPRNVPQVSTEECLRHDISLINDILDNAAMIAGPALPPLLRQLPQLNQRLSETYPVFIRFAQTSPQSLVHWRFCQEHLRKMAQLNLSDPVGSFNTMRLSWRSSQQTHRAFPSPQPGHGLPMRQNANGFLSTRQVHVAPDLQQINPPCALGTPDRTQHYQHGSQLQHYRPIYNAFQNLQPVYNHHIAGPNFAPQDSTSSVNFPLNTRAVEQWVQSGSTTVPVHPTIRNATLPGNRFSPLPSPAPYTPPASSRPTPRPPQPSNLRRAAPSTPSLPSPRHLAPAKPRATKPSEPRPHRVVKPAAPTPRSDPHPEQTLEQALIHFNGTHPPPERPNPFIQPPRPTTPAQSPLPLPPPKSVISTLAPEQLKAARIAHNKRVFRELYKQSVNVLAYCFYEHQEARRPLKMGERPNQYYVSFISNQNLEKYEKAEDKRVVLYARENWQMCWSVKDWELARKEMRKRGWEGPTETDHVWRIWG
ncbi:unnamed protein product [Periconia digitata]|uniref:Uncharacterized protein n=1 Tax=Periconia digitata TaxID=1303443 RepID=A0A9W4U0I0_9PLEO|nr:unnamed protein product [Periconia digitata]